MRIGRFCVEADMNGETAVFRNLRDRLFAKPAADQAVKKLSARNTVFAPVFCDGAEAAVAAVRDAIAADDPFAVAFLDMRMPPGPDGVWAAARIRELDPAIEIVLVHGVFRRRSGAKWARSCRPRRSFRTCKSRFIRTRFAR